MRQGIMRRLTHVDEELDVSALEIVEDAGLIQVGQRTHVLPLLELRGVHQTDVVLLERLLLHHTKHRDSQ